MKRGILHAPEPFAAFMALLAAALALPSCTRARLEFNDRAVMQATPLTANYGYTQTAETIPRLGDRTYMTSVLEEVFGSTSVVSGTRTTANVVQDYVQDYLGYFGGPCDPNDSTANRDCGSTRANSQLPLIPGAVPAREALKMQACEELTSASAALDHAITAAGGTSSTSPGAAMLGSAWELFHMGETMPSQVEEALTELMTAVSENSSISESERPLEQWRFLFLTLCRDPSWEIP